MYVIGSIAFIANEAIESEPSYAVGEWMSDVYVPPTNGSSSACLMFDLKFEEFPKRINVELIYQDLNDTIHKASLFDSDIGSKDSVAKERSGTFEFRLNNVLKYQVCALVLLLIRYSCSSFVK